tara:strand:+ start:31 stop:261 length:231 start_codon:yes stop_codon:yes gene_type:complete
MATEEDRRQADSDITNVREAIRLLVWSGLACKAGLDLVLSEKAEEHLASVPKKSATAVRRAAKMIVEQYETAPVEE